MGGTKGNTDFIQGLYQSQYQVRSGLIPANNQPLTLIPGPTKGPIPIPRWYVQKEIPAQGWCKPQSDSSKMWAAAFMICRILHATQFMDLLSGFGHHQVQTLK